MLKKKYNQKNFLNFYFNKLFFYKNAKSANLNKIKIIKSLTDFKD